MQKAEPRLAGSCWGKDIYGNKNQKIVATIEARMRRLHNFECFVGDAVSSYVVSEGIGSGDTYGPLLNCEGNKATIRTPFFKEQITSFLGYHVCEGPL